jgi:DNA repair exonuclease SbcCD nuclease subunit
LPVYNIFKSLIGHVFHPNASENETLYIHASDLHLGSHQYRSEERAKDFIRAFQEILFNAIIHVADFIILGGDVFTSLDMLPGHLNEIITILMDFNEYTKNSIPIIAIEGNHDIRKFSRGIRFSKRGQSWLKVISNLGLVVLLDADFEETPEKMFQFYDPIERKGGKIRIKNVIIYGNRYVGETKTEHLNKIAQAIDKDDGMFHILLQHFGIAGQMEKVPGVNYLRLNPLKDRVDYLALGHYHLQFTIDNWVFNPGSSEAVSSADFSFKRGIFLVKIKGKGEYEKIVRVITLNNRKFIWEHLNFTKSLNNYYILRDFVLNKLEVRLHHLSRDLKPSNSRMPILYLILKGRPPQKSCKIDVKDLRNAICEYFPVIDVRIYQKFTESVILLQNYF